MNIYILNGWPVMDCPVCWHVATSEEGLIQIIDNWLNESTDAKLDKNSVVFSENMDSVTFSYYAYWDEDKEDPSSYTWVIIKPKIHGGVTCQKSAT